MMPSKKDASPASLTAELLVGRWRARATHRHGGGALNEHRATSPAFSCYANNDGLGMAMK
jgi:hypothetical protein